MRNSYTITPSCPFRISQFKYLSHLASDWIMMSMKNIRWGLSFGDKIIAFCQFEAWLDVCSFFPCRSFYCLRGNTQSAKWRLQRNDYCPLSLLSLVRCSSGASNFERMKCLINAYIFLFIVITLLLEERARLTVLDAYYTRWPESLL